MAFNPILVQIVMEQPQGKNTIDKVGEIARTLSELCEIHNLDKPAV
jgi:hypothetical protein